MRAFTNPIANSVVLSQFNLGEGLDTTARMQLPARCLPQFMHEVMHHWCFNSPVGLALALLQMRARRNAAKAQLTGSTNASQYLIAQDLCRVSASLEFMKPLSEGLALFAEHDVFPGDSKVIGTPLMMASMMFAGRQKDYTKYLEYAPFIFGSVRTTTAYLRRKANLLLQSFVDTSAQYLQGYLTIKSLYRIGVERCAAYQDSEFFSHVLRCWLYDDWDFVEFLLDTSKDYEKWTKTLIVKVQERTAQFHRLSEKDIHHFEQRGVAGDADTFTYRGGLLELGFHSHPVTTVSPKHAGKAALGSILEELFGSLPNEPSLRSMVESDLVLLGLRKTITLGHGTFSASVTAGNMIQLRIDKEQKFPVFATGAPEALKAGWSSAVNVELLLLTEPFGAFQFILDKSGIVAAQSMGADAEIPAYLQTPLVNWELRHEKMKDEDQLISAVLEDTLEEDVLEMTMNQVRRTRDSAFELKALLLVPDSALEHAKKLLAQDGFLGALGGSLPLLMDAAAISSCSSLRRDPKDILPEWDWSCGSYLKTAERINHSFKQTLGYEPFILHKGVVVHSMV